MTLLTRHSRIIAEVKSRKPDIPTKRRVLRYSSRIVKTEQDKTCSCRCQKKSSPSKAVAKNNKTQSPQQDGTSTHGWVYVRTPRAALGPRTQSISANAQGLPELRMKEDLQSIKLEF